MARKLGIISGGEDDFGQIYQMVDGELHVFPSSHVVIVKTAIESICSNPNVNLKARGPENIADTAFEIAERVEERYKEKYEGEKNERNG